MKLTLKPQDILFFRDGRPMEGSDMGHGGNWVLPGIFHDALMTSFIMTWNEIQEWEHPHKKNDCDQNESSSFRFGGLKTIGPFPYVGDTVYFPTPNDIVLENDEKCSLLKVELPLGESNLPSPLKYNLVRRGVISKEEIPKQWISFEHMKKYLKGDLDIETYPNKKIFITENRYGIEIDSKTDCAKDKKLYSAEYMRLMDNIELYCEAECLTYSHSKENGAQETDVLRKWRERGIKEITLGGQCGIAKCFEIEKEIISKKCSFFEPDQDGVYRIKLVLLSPAIFTSGWLPGWVDESNGEIKIKPSIERNGMKREVWRKQFKDQQNIGARLVAVRVSGCFKFSGWSLIKKAPKATQSAVPAGSVYYFECFSKKDAEDFVKWVENHRVSDVFGEKGFGYAVCGKWELNKNQ
ncbi:MAG: hypothetical protein ACD_79C00496G0004 [uncultured bacterium]|nr:MAG: hypothetical protein ACD_79C00496G0004 [uncultured bacterium]